MSDDGEPHDISVERQPDVVRTRVVVLFGGQSNEHDVSLRSAQTVIGALDPERYEVRQVGITRDGRWLTSGDPMRALASDSPFFSVAAQTDEAADGGEPVSPETAMSALAGEAVDVVFPVLHGPMGEDGTVQGLLELAGIPYVGSGVLGSAVAMDKAMAKHVLAQAGITQAPWRLVSRRQWTDGPAAVATAIGGHPGYPCFVKPANMGSSVGVSKVHGPEELADAMDLALHHDRRVVVEANVSGRELEISVLGNDDPIASVAGEIKPSREFYDYEAKYVDHDSELIIPAELPAGKLDEMREIAVQAFLALDLAGLARVDFFLELGTESLLLNEVNTLPGFTSISMFPMLWAASGLPLAELVDRLVELALERRSRA